LGLRTLARKLIDTLPAPLGLWLIDLSRRARFAFYRDLRRHNRRIHRLLGQPRRILAGPFAGMPYIANSSGSAFLPKIVGTYELEIAAAIETIKATPHDLIIDIGAAEGYYAVGLARACAESGARIICFEAHKPARYLLNRLARLNQLDGRIDVQGFCTPTLLAPALTRADHSAIICDCEGGEDVLLNPAAIPALTRATILVELHEKAAPGIGRRLRARFAPTHHIDQYNSRDRTPADLPPSIPLQGEDVAIVLSEYRNEPNSWYFMRPKTEEGTADDARSL
jgi:predicted O-methyltransferase YrrM